MFFLKFIDTKAHAESTLNGHFFLNTLGYFLENGDEGQRDMFEGVFTTINVDNSHFPKELTKGLKYNPRFRAVGYKYCNVSCMSAVNCIPSLQGKAYFRWPGNMNAFGESVLVIQNPKALFTRAIEAANREGYKIICGKVNYHDAHRGDFIQTQSAKLTWKATEDRTFDTMIPEAEHFYDSFDKHRKYEYQNEWRISLYRGEKTEDAYKNFYIGDLHDIAFIRPANEIASEAGRNMLLSIINLEPDRKLDYMGNCGREKMRELFFELGDRKSTLFFGT